MAGYLTAGSTGAGSAVGIGLGQDCLRAAGSGHIGNGRILDPAVVIVIVAALCTAHLVADDPVILVVGEPCGSAVIVKFLVGLGDSVIAIAAKTVAQLALWKDRK